MHDTYLIEVLEDGTAKLHGPFAGHVDSYLTEKLQEEMGIGKGWIGSGITNPRWMRNKDRLYRVTIRRHRQSRRCDDSDSA